jgi:hypothetical protein
VEPTLRGLNIVERAAFTSHNYAATFFRDNHGASRLLLFISTLFVQIEACIIIGF